ncbi:MAG: protein kinase domain-containing protein [Planctomycetota bacterium]
MAAQTTFGPGDQIGTLSLERELGRGAYGVVFLARDTMIGRSVALKVLHGTGGEVPTELREQVLLESRLLARLNNPFIVTLYRLHSLPDGGWIQEMELVEGGNVDDQMEEDTAFALEKAVRVFRGVCLALKAAHAARILHGDIKPANVLFGRGDVVKLADFGFARMLEATGAAIQLHGQAYGSPLYMAPEVITGQEAGMASDLWSAVVLFYRLLTGRFPFPATTVGELMQKVTGEDPAPLGPEVPEPLAELILRCLVKRSEERLASAEIIVRELDRLALQDRRLAPVSTASERPTNYVPAATTFVGREEELAAIGALLAQEGCQLVTVTGPGGIGKTRIAQQVCAEQLERFEGGCWLADLSATRDADGIAHAVAEALGVEHSADEEPVVLVSGVLQYRKPMLLVLDNFEQVLDHGMSTVGAWMRAAPHVRFLVTSRALLSIEGERHFELSPLPAPATDSEAARDPQEARVFAGVRLFEDRARLANPEFELEAGNTADVVRICSELDGMPLAIELAAARSRIMAPAEIARKLGEKFELLKSTRRDLAPRQKTLTGALEWSYELLEDWEKEFFLQACYFRESFSLAAAEEVIDLTAFEAAPPLVDIAQGLRDKSLLTAFLARQETRLGMYRAIREYGEAKWGEIADESRHRSLAGRHAHYFLEFADEWNGHIPGVRDEEALDRIALEIGNLTGVEDWALQQGDGALAARAVLAMAETMRVRHPPRQLAPLLEQALRAFDQAPSEVAVRLRNHLSATCQRSGDWDRAVRNADEAVAMARGLEAPGSLAAALLQRGEMLRNRGHLDEALRVFSESEALAQEAGDRRTLARSTGDKGMVLGEKGDLDQAWECFCAAEAAAREIADRQTVALHVGNRGVVCESRGELDQALVYHREAEEISRRIGNRLRVAITLGNQANVLVQQGAAEAGLLCYREAEAIARELGARQRIAQIVGNRGAAHAMWGELDEALACYVEAETIARELGDKRRTAVSLSQRANTYSRRKEYDAAIKCFEEAEAIGEAIGDRYLVARNLCLRGTVLAKINLVDEAWAALHAGVRMFDEMHANRSVWYFTFKAVLADVTRARGEQEAALELAREALELASRLGLKAGHPDQGVREGLARLEELVEG